MNPTRQEAACEVLAEMQNWLRLSLETYRAAVFMFAIRLPPDKLIEALWIAQSRKPKGDFDSFRYFCGVCHSMLREMKGELARN